MKESAGAASLTPPLHHHHHHQHRLRKKLATTFAKPTAYIFLLLVSYIFGYLSASSSSSNSNIINHHNYPPPPRSSINTTNRAITNQVSATAEDHNLFGTVCAAKAVPPKLVRRTILDRVFNGTSPYDNFPPPHISHVLRPNKISGWGSTGAVFEHLIRKVKPKTIIEVGTFLGASALHMVKLTRQLGLPDTQILCVDDFRGWPGFQDRFKDIKTVNGDVMLMYQFMQNVVQAGATETVMMVPFSTEAALEKLCTWGIYGDLIEVDAAHDFHSAWSDINRAYKILNPGGVLFGHDYFSAVDNRGVRRAVNLFARLHHFRVQVHGQHWLLYPIK
ncbi:hypothetical protein ACH5RR_000028 [Cinchona calisaya]|uniref:S-adenosyl-L-methionine-dependent methyltransferase n=1 Tax=Cinchona calisaya TaxID=153742 RepID=A0ABD3AZG4_9GENT